MSAIITTKNLSKKFKVPIKEPGLGGSLKSLFNRQYRIVSAVDNINLTINEGEFVGFIGPNGAGKTTTLKMLSGLLYPTSGEARVMGYVPQARHKNFLKRFSLVMGQKQQLWWDLPLYDSLLLQRDIYELSTADFEKNLAELRHLLDLDDFLKMQVRKLSLGQRMRGELAAALIYHPKVLFLDEPTIGLDVVVQQKIRGFLTQYQRQHQATIILTSHYLDDVRELCPRLIIIDHGKVAFDGATNDLITQHVDHKRVVLTFSTKVTKETLVPYGQVVEWEEGTHAILHVPRRETSTAAARILQHLPVQDIAIEDPSLEDVVRELFLGKDYA
ncbi:MAG: ATP-binding cassette domain-containing protein [Candidatus Andersenbacteria bacterium]